MTSITSEIFRGAFASIAQNKLGLFRRLFPLVFLLTVLDTTIIFYFFETEYEASNNEFFGSLFLYLFFLIKLIFYTYIAIITHRVILLGADSVSNWGVYKWTRRETNFSVRIVILGLILLPADFLSFLPTPISLVATIFFLWAAGRLALTFPGIAVDEKMTFNLSWNWTRNYNFLMLIIVGLIPAIFSVASILMAMQLRYFYFFWNLLLTISLIFEITLVSHAYKSIKNRAVIANNRMQSDAAEPRR